MNYPIVTAGLVLGPRGVGTMAAMLVVGRLIGPVDTRILLGTGLGLTAWSFYAMTGWTPDVSQTTIILVGVIQGIGLGFIFVPLSTVTLSTLSNEERAEGAGLYSLSRNIGSKHWHLGSQQLVVTEHAGESRRHCGARHGPQSNLCRSNHSAVLESIHRGRTRCARCNDHAAGAGHCLHRRLQTADDRDAPRDPVADRLHASVRQRQ